MRGVGVGTSSGKCRESRLYVQTRDCVAESPWRMLAAYYIRRQVERQKPEAEWVWKYR
jgi:hypothetical protein